MLLSNIHAGSESISESLSGWIVDRSEVRSVPPDVAALAEGVRSDADVLMGYGREDAGKADDIERRLDLVMTEADRFAQAEDPTGMVSVEFAAALASLEHTTRDYWLHEIDELGESRAIVSVTKNILLVLGPLFVATGLWLAAVVSRLRVRADRAELAESRVQSNHDFLARVSHEIRTPLTGLVGMSELLCNESFAEGKVAEMHTSIAAASAELRDLVEDLLTVSVSEIDQFPVRLSAIDISESIDASVDSFVGSGAVIRTETETARALADQARFRQIMRNLLSNAIRYGGADIAVNLCVHDGLVETVVSDDGPAISAEIVTRMFDPYVTSGGSPGDSGLGIGLALSRDLARRMGGELDHRRTGDRTEFILTLKAVAPALQYQDAP